MVHAAVTPRRSCAVGEKRNRLQLDKKLNCDNAPSLLGQLTQYVCIAAPAPSHHRRDATSIQLALQSSDGGPCGLDTPHHPGTCVDCPNAQHMALAEKGAERERQDKEEFFKSVVLSSSEPANPPRGPPKKSCHMP